MKKQKHPWIKSIRIIYFKTKVVIALGIKIENNKYNPIQYSI
jgi:hypothetical protein